MLQYGHVSLAEGHAADAQSHGQGGPSEEEVRRFDRLLLEAYRRIGDADAIHGKRTSRLRFSAN